jgi:ribose/xylose/arabinose/galactoside ABC-type transport system permease subunit
VKHRARLPGQLADHAAWILSVLAILVVIALVPVLQRPTYWFQLCHQNFAIALLALAMTPILLAGGIDLSVGSTSVLASILCMFLVQRVGWPLEMAFAAAVVTGLVAGLGNAVLVLLGIPALVATLATRELYRGLAFRIHGDAYFVGLREAGSAWWHEQPGGLPVPLYGIALMFLLTYCAVHHTWVGRMLFAVGDNEEAARYATVPVRRLKLGLYAWAGLVAGVCGVAAVLEYGSARPDSDQTLELTAIACAVLGGVRVTGGSGYVAGTLLGIVTLTTLLAAVQNVADMWRDTVTGALLLVVALGNEAASRWQAGRLQEGTA